jgi:hypothetical protein
VTLGSHTSGKSIIIIIIIIIIKLHITHFERVGTLECLLLISPYQNTTESNIIMLLLNHELEGDFI